MTDQVNEALVAIKASVDEKFDAVAIKADVDVAVELKADKAELLAVKGAFEALEAKFDAMPAPALVSPTLLKAVPMNVNEIFEKNLAESGKAFADVEIKAITEARDVTGGVTEVTNLFGNMFAGNPVRSLASVMQVSSTAIVMPVRTGSHSAANQGATQVTPTSGNAAVGELTIVAQQYDAASKIAIASQEDIPGFDAFWAGDMLAEVGSVEAAAHVTTVEAITANTAAASATALALDDFAGLIFDVQPQYRASGSLLVSTGAMQQLRTLNSSGTGSDLLFDAQLGGFRLFGVPVVENPYMAAVAATNVVAAFGDWKRGMVITNRKSASVGRYSETAPGFYTYYASMRAGAGLRDASALRKLTMA